jgi:hypothetical protein
MNLPLLVNRVNCPVLNSLQEIVIVRHYPLLDCVAQCGPTPTWRNCIRLRFVERLRLKQDKKAMPPIQMR